MERTELATAATTTARGPGLLRPLRVRDFRLVFTGETVSVLDPALEWVALAVLSVALILIGRVVFRRTEHRMRVRGTLGQH